MKSHSLFSQILFGFIISISIFAITLLLFFKIGMSDAIIEWENHSLGILKDIAITVLTKDANPEELNIPQDEPIFIYNENRELVYSNRGSGKKNPQEKEYLPLVYNGEIVGYLYTLQLHFLDNYANKQFTFTLNKAVITSLLVSVIIVLLLALYISNKISKPAKKIAHYLGVIENNRGGKTIEIKGSHEIKQIVNAVNSLQNRLSHEESIRQQWAMDIAHDLRTPVSALKAQFEGMLHDVLDITKLRIQRNFSEVVRMELLVEDLSELIKLEEPEIKVYNEEINAIDFIQEITSKNIDILKSKNINLTIQRDIETFRGDEMLLYRAISNLWNNALRHTNINGYISIIFSRKNDQTEIKVINSGDIISRTELSKIFNRLYRGETARKSKGSGLGLTITKQIVELHHGEIDVISDDDNGTVFTVRI